MMAAIRRLVLAAATAIFAGGAAAAENAWPEARHVISGADYRIVAAAVDGVAASGRFLHVPLEAYELVLAEEDDFYTVYFTDPNRVDGIRGSSPNMPEFEARVRKSDLYYIGSVFWR